MILDKDNIFTKYKINPSLSQNEIIAIFQKTPELRKILPNIYSKLKDTSYLALCSLETVFYEELDKKSDKSFNAIKIENDYGFNFNWVKKNFSAYKNTELINKDLTLFLLGAIIFYLTALRNNIDEDNLKLIETIIEMQEKLSSRNLKNVNKLTKSLSDDQVVKLKEDLFKDINYQISQISKDIISDYDPKKVNLLFQSLNSNQRKKSAYLGVFYEELSNSIEKSNEKVEDETVTKIINLLVDLDKLILDNPTILKSVKYFFSKLRDNMKDDYFAYISSLEVAEKVLNESDFIAHLSSFTDLGNYVVLNLFKSNVISKSILNKISITYSKYSQSIINNEKYSVILSKQKISKDSFTRINDTFNFFSSLNSEDYKNIQSYYDLVSKKLDLKVNLYELIRIIVLNNPNENVKFIMANLISTESGFYDRLSSIFEYKAKQLTSWLEEYVEKNIDTYATITHLTMKDSSIVSYNDYYEAINYYYSLTALNPELIETFDGIIRFIVSPVFTFIKKLNSDSSIMSTYGSQQNIKSAFDLYFSKFSPNDYYSIKEKKTLSQRFAEANVSQIISLSGNSQTRSYIEKCNKIKNDTRDNNENNATNSKASKSTASTSASKTKARNNVANVNDNYDSDFDEVGSYTTTEAPTTGVSTADTGIVILFILGIVALIIFFVAPQIIIPTLFFVWLFYRISKS